MVVRSESFEGDGEVHVTAEPVVQAESVTIVHGAKVKLGTWYRMELTTGERARINADGTFYMDNAKEPTMQEQGIKNRFTYRPPSAAKVEVHQQIRQWGLDLAYDLNEVLPEGREKSLAITKLEEVVMWANAAVARDTSTEDDES
jgi:hypothetical protein